MLTEALVARRMLRKTAAKMPAFKGPFWKRMQKTVSAQAPKAAITALGAGAVFGGAYAFNKARRAMDYNKDYSAMMAEHPSLREEDEHLVRSRFNTLHTLAPTLSNDPLVAGSIVKQWIEYPVLTAAAIKDVASVEKDLKQDPGLLKQLVGAATALGGGGS